MSLYRKICAVRALCVPYEIGRWLWHGTFGWLEQKGACWYRLGNKNFQPKQPAQRIHRPLCRHEAVHYNLDNALQQPGVKGFAFIFFMGIGDYLYTTPLWPLLKKKYPHLPFYAYVGASFDRNNSPLVGKLLEQNPCFEKVFYFNGHRHPLIWKNYDYEDAFKNIPPGFLAIPVYYDYSKQVTHRVVSLFDVFGLPLPEKLPVPVLPFPAVAPLVVAQTLQLVRQKTVGKKGVVFLQLDSRSSNYTYPYVRALAEGLIRDGYVVISVTPGGPLERPEYMELDIKKMTINQTWQLLHLLKQEVAVYVISVVSVFWAASAGLELPNLGMQHWVDPKIHNVWYPNIEVITHRYYPFLPREKQLIAPPESYTPHNRTLVDFKPDWVLKCFHEKFG
ncbi:MAG: hypothetical protein MJ053_00955 [Elusimicrobiaceae bacterium]|nr:hypothetical protein [Elusimicrobiaceae bacterium]